MAGAKRKYDQESADQLYTNKSRSRPSVEARVDPTYGQRSAIPGLDDDTIINDLGEGLDYEEDMDALAYLRAVREEATGIPNLLVAPKQNVDEYGRDLEYDGSGFSHGYYEDGAYYTSDPVPASSDTGAEGEVGNDPQLAYFDSILTRFESLREQLSQIPPAEAVRKLDKDHPTHLGKLNTEVSRWWRWKMRTVDPLPVQIACMDKATVLRLLGLMTGGALLKNGMEVDVGISRWAWGLLARLPDRGELTSEEIGVVRELGKKAVLVGMGLREDKQWEEGITEVEAGYELDDDFGETGSYTNQEEISLDMDDDIGEIEMDLPQDSSNAQKQEIGPQLPRDDGDVEPHLEKADECTSTKNGDSEETESQDDISLAKARILARLQGQKAADGRPIADSEGESIDETSTTSPSSKWNTRATVDMIITVAGEIFGQRDLLEFRSIWGEIL